MKNDKHFVFGSATIKGSKETLYLTKDSTFRPFTKKNELMIFDNLKQAFEHIESKGLDLADCDKLTNF